FLQRDETDSSRSRIVAPAELQIAGRDLQIARGARRFPSSDCAPATLRLCDQGHAGSSLSYVRCFGLTSPGPDPTVVARPAFVSEAPEPVRARTGIGVAFSDVRRNSAGICGGKRSPR